ncbi:hypothetical protein LCGC14_0809150 [marine sediment metagenome]|uniref:NADAR domain-containing protein n=1 Tax=marine sediment metagenome TaxID=412755 RepID=A0A0F9PRU7_9ZZZZ
MATQQDSCVQGILSKKLGPGEKPSKQDLAIAFSECSEKKASNALDNLKIKLATSRIPSHIRYLTASLDSEFIANPEKQGKFASYFLLKGDEVNGREWGVTSSSIPANIESFIGRPLVATGDKFIVEASPTDCIWGIGMSCDDPGITDPKNWRGTNWLGKAIMKVRDVLKREIEDAEQQLKETCKDPNYTFGK